MTHRQVVLIPVKIPRSWVGVQVMFQDNVTEDGEFIGRYNPTLFHFRKMRNAISEKIRSLGFTPAPASLRIFKKVSALCDKYAMSMKSAEIY